MGGRITRVLKRPVLWLLAALGTLFGGWIVERAIVLAGGAKPRDVVIDQALLAVGHNWGMVGGLLAAALIVGLGCWLGAREVAQTDAASARYNAAIDNNLAQLMTKLGHLQARMDWHAQWTKKVERAHFLRAKRAELRRAIRELREFEKQFIAQSRDPASILRLPSPAFTARLAEVRSFRMAVYRSDAVHLDLTPREKAALEGAVDAFEGITRAPLRQTFVESHRSILTTIAQGEKLRNKMAADVREIEAELAKRGKETNS